MMRFFRKGFALLLALACAGPAWAADQSSSNSPFGLYFSAHGDPAPSIYGLNLTFRPKLLQLIRFEAGVGGFNADIYNGSVTLVNDLFLGIAYGFYWFFAHATLNRPNAFKNWKIDTIPQGDCFTYGGGAKLVIPVHSDLVQPVVGVNWSHEESTFHPWGIPDSSSQVYFSAGADFFTKPMTIGAGFNWCPNLPIASCGVYFNFGTYL